MMFTIIIVLLLILVSIIILYRYQCNARNYWKNRGFHTLTTDFWLGSFKDAMLKKKSGSSVIKELYDELKERNLKFGGAYLAQHPILMIQDLNLLKLIGITNFEYFTGRFSLIEKSHDELLGHSLFNLHGDEWRQMRHKLSPSFTGNKLRNMVPLIEISCKELAVYITENSGIIDILEILRRFTADVIATTAFGSPSDAIKDPNSQFYYYGNTLLDIKGMRKLVVTGYLLFPALMRLLRIPFLPKPLSIFFKSKIKENILFREEQNMSRPDMVQLLIDDRKRGADISDLDIAAQALTFFLGGFETVARTLTFAALELAANPNIQENLRREVDDAFRKNDGELDFELVHNLKYMDMVVSEVLRMHPPVPFADRTCSKDFHINEYDLYIKEGERVGFPFYAIHHDPEYFPEPHIFKPERFSEIEKYNIVPFTYLPFGIGPRNCIASRFALLEVKLALAYTIRAVELKPGPETKYPIELDPNRLDNYPIGGTTLNIIPRK